MWQATVSLGFVILSTLAVGESSPTSPACPSTGSQGGAVLLQRGIVAEPPLKVGGHLAAKAATSSDPATVLSKVDGASPNVSGILPLAEDTGGRVWDAGGHLISEMIGSDLLGDPFEPTEHGKPRSETTNASAAGAAAVHSHAKGEHGFVALLFFFGILAFSAAVLLILERLAPTVQSSCALFVTGGLVSVVHFYKPKAHWLVWDSFSVSIEMWQGVNPHLLFFAFLPALLFSEVMQIRVQLFKTCFAQVFMLACPGVLVSTGLLGSFAHYVLPYDWGWPISLALGAILSATDPVAVVSLFNTLGVSPKLTMLISGESLLNDGSAICVFALMLKVVQGAEISPYDTAVFFTHMIFTSVALGFVMGLGAVVIIGVCAEDHYASDAMIQFIVTMCCSYLTFFLAESELSTSGVLATVTSGLVTAYMAWPRFVSRETMHIVWEAINFIANTVIFFLAGVLFANICLQRQSYIQGADVGWLFVFYIAMLLVRAFMVVLFWVPLNMVGSELHWYEGIVMVWGGLRGAVSLAMAMIVDLEPNIDHRMGSRIMFYVGGCATLTMLVNATTCAPLLRYLGLTKVSCMKEEMLRQFEVLLDEETRKSFEDARGSSSMRFRDVSVPLVKAMVPDLAEASGDGLGTISETSDVYSLEQMYREVFVRIVQHHYWDMIEEGVLGKNMLITRLLIHSCDEALDSTKTELNDWGIIQRWANDVIKPSFLRRVLSDMSQLPALNHLSWFRQLFSQNVQLRRMAYVSLCFQDAHRRARDEVPRYFGTDGSSVKSQQAVCQESEKECELAEELLQHVPVDAIELGKAKMLSRKLLQQRMNKVNLLHDQGLLTAVEASNLNEKSLSKLRRILHTPKAEWLARAGYDTSSQSLTQSLSRTSSANSGL